MHGDITLVAPNGARITENYRPHDTVGKTLEHAVREFGKNKDLDPTKEYILVLGDLALSLDRRLEDVGVVAGSVLKVRAKQIPVDGNASGVL